MSSEKSPDQVQTAQKLLYFTTGKISFHPSSKGGATVVPVLGLDTAAFSEQNQKNPELDFLQCQDSSSPSPVGKVPSTGKELGAHRKITEGNKNMINQSSLGQVL